MNKVILIGNLGTDPEIRYTKNGIAVASFRMATSEKWKDANGNMQEATEWHNIVAWQRHAEICGEYLAKGSKVCIEGRLQTRKWQDQSGTDRYTTEIIVKSLELLTPRNSSSNQYYQQPANTMPQPGFITPPTSDDIPF